MLRIPMWKWVFKAKDECEMPIYIEHCKWWINKNYHILLMVVLQRYSNTWNDNFLGSCNKLRVFQLSVFFLPASLQPLALYYFQMVEYNVFETAETVDFTYTTIHPSQRWIFGTNIFNWFLIPHIFYPGYANKTNFLAH